MVWSMLLLLMVVVCSAEDVLYSDFEEEQNLINTVDRSGELGAVDRSGAVAGAAAKLEKQFLYLAASIPDKIDAGIAEVREDLSGNNLRSQSYGWALVAGGLGDTAADYVANTRMPQDILTMPDVVYSYGYNIGYGIGFGGPFLLPTYLADTKFGCSSLDFLSVLSKYGLRNGITYSHISKHQLVSFGLESRESVHCLLKHSGDYAAAAEVGYLLDDLVEAGTQVLNLRHS